MPNDCRVRVLELGCSDTRLNPSRQLSDVDVETDRPSSFQPLTSLGREVTREIVHRYTDRRDR